MVLISKWTILQWMNSIDRKGPSARVVPWLFPLKYICIIYILIKMCCCRPTPITMQLYVNTKMKIGPMMTSSNGNIFRVTGHLCGEFPAQRPVTRSFDIFLDLRLNKRLSKQSWGWWFETLSHPLWPHCNALYKRTETSQITLKSTQNRCSLLR